MKAHTEQYKETIKKFGRELDSKITYELDGETIELGVQELNSITPHYEGNILKSVMRQLDIDSNVDIPLETEINYQFGIKVDNYVLTEDTEYLEGKIYYSYEDEQYIILEPGEDYEIGDTITGDVYDTSQEFEYINFGNYIVYSNEKQEDLKSYKIVCYDKMLYSMKDYESIGVTYPITIRNYLIALCNHLGLVFKNASDTFANYNREIQNELYLDSEGNTLGYTFRDVLDELAQVTASTICINENDNELEIRYINTTGDTIDEEYLKDINVNFGEKYGPINSIVLSRSGGSDNVYLRDEASVTENGLCEIKIADNQIMNFNDRSDYLPDILAKLDGLEYYINDFTSTGITYYNLCDRYIVNVENNGYSCIMFNDEINITQGLEEHIYTDLPEESETDYTKSDKTDRRINQTYIIVDKQNQVIESVVSNVTDQNNKISQITQTVDELNSKISDIADITISAESYEAKVNLNNINAGEPIRVVIRPTALEDVSYLYPSIGIFPTNNYMPDQEGLVPRYGLTPSNELVPRTGRKGQGILYPKQRKITFYNSKTDELFDYILPYDLYYYDANNYDEFVLDYDSEVCYVIKKIGINEYGDKYILSNQQVIDIEYPHIAITSGNYEIYLDGYSKAYLFVRMMVENIYTSQFATKAEMTSAINQKANEINATVSLKLDEEEFTHASIVLKINDDTSSALIEADKIDLNATKIINLIAGNTINLTSKNIAITSTNFKVTTAGAMTCSNATITGGSLKVGNNFTVTTAGNLTANNANITGTINATSGTIGGCTISNGTLQIANANIGSLNVSKLTSGTNSQAVTFTNINATGKVNATSGSFSGSLYSSAGTIGGWNLSGSNLYGASSGTTSYLSPNGVTAMGTFGTASKTWYQILTGTSDKRFKNAIKNLDNEYENFYDNLKPVSFKYNKELEKDTYDQTHFGFIAQDIIQNEKDNKLNKLAMIWGNKDFLQLDKQEIIALNTWQIQKLKQRVEELEKKLEEK